jgi:hypothetical protein
VELRVGTVVVVDLYTLGPDKRWTVQRTTPELGDPTDSDGPTLGGQVLTWDTAGLTVGSSHEVVLVLRDRGVVHDRLAFTLVFVE